MITVALYYVFWYWFGRAREEDPSRGDDVTFYGLVPGLEADANVRAIDRN